MSNIKDEDLVAFREIIGDTPLIPYNDEDLKGIIKKANALTDVFKGKKTDVEVDPIAAFGEFATFLTVIAMQKDLLTIKSLASKLEDVKNNITVGDAESTRSVRGRSK
jgi:hypothetical protein